MDSTSTSSPYPAVELDLHLRQVRLVTILPGRYIDAIICELSIASLDNMPEYCSLSYAWGDRTDLRQILLNGVSFNITRNLEASLRRLRHPTESRLFWIDMLSINQDYVEERTHQVNLMQLIYSGAREVFLWLGDYTETTLQKASPALQSNESQEDLTQLEAVRALGYIERHSTGQHLEFSEEGTLPLRLVEEVEALEKLMNRPWWDRIWTVQEAILPPKVTVIVGRLQLNWNTLAKTAKSFLKHRSSNCCFIPGKYEYILYTFYHQVDKIQSARIDYHGGKSLDFLHLLHKFRDKSSTDPRDKIFGLLGLVMGDPKYRTLQADYTLSAEAVYQRAFIYLLQGEENLNLLLRQTEEERILDLPTWTPDWTAKVDVLDADVHLDISRDLHIYNASLSAQPCIRWPGTTKILGVKGLMFDEVTTVPASFSDHSSPSRNGHIEYLQTLFNIAKRHSRLYVEDGDSMYAFWRLVSMERLKEFNEDIKSAKARRMTLEDYNECPNMFRLDTVNTFSMVRSFQFFISKMGYIGLGPEKMRVGDTVHVLLGGSVPFVLRQVGHRTAVSGEQARYEYIGHCYVQGIMDGEALHGVDINNLDWINLV